MKHHGKPPGGGPLHTITPATVIGFVLFVGFVGQLVTSPLRSLSIHLPAGGGRRFGAADDAGAASRAWRGGRVEVSKRSHEYLKGAFPGARPDAFVAAVTAGLDARLTAQREQLTKEESFYSPWIQRDLEPWAEAGITRDLVEGAADMYDICDGDMLRFHILNGSLWVHHITERRGGWYPAVLGPENVAAKGRVPYVLLALLEVLRAFPGQIPDVDAVVHTADFPCVRRKWAHGAVPTPIFGYQGSVRHFDLPFPDYSFFGNEYQYLQDPWGNPTMGWEAQACILAAKYGNVSLLDRIPQASSAMWRGRTKDKIYPHRDRLRRKFVECVGKARPADAALVSPGPKPAVALQETYNVYIESDAYASNLKQKLACGSLLVALKMEYWEFYGRALQPGQHYVEITNEEDHVCEELLPLVRDLNDMFDTKGRSVLRVGGTQTPTLAARKAEMRRDPRLARLLEGGATEAPAPGPTGNYSWGSALLPWEIAQNGAGFVAERLRMEDALLYLRDVLRGYAALQRFRVKPLAKSVCYTGDRVLEQFATPHAKDGAMVGAAYPWLRGYDGGCAESEARYGTY
eukprot:scaffold20.g7639.t1